jgi:hypothetical protein
LRARGWQTNRQRRRRNGREDAGQNEHHRSGLLLSAGDDHRIHRQVHSRDQDGDGKQMAPSVPAGRENEGAILKSPAAPADRTGLILLLAEKLVPAMTEPDEHEASGILTWGFGPCSRLPAAASGRSGDGSL